jgi:hypothetical protein
MIQLSNLGFLSSTSVENTTIELGSDAYWRLAELEKDCSTPFW